MQKEYDGDGQETQQKKQSNALDVTDVLAMGTPNELIAALELADVDLIVRRRLCSIARSNRAARRLISTRIKQWPEAWAVLTIAQPLTPTKTDPSVRTGLSHYVLKQS